MGYVSGMLSVVVPAYNEEKRIYNNLLEICKSVETFCPSYEIILVNDGSPDGTLQEALRARATNSRIKVLTYERNRGKGGAIKAGVERAKGEYIAFLDADLDISPEHLQIYMAKMLEKNADLVIGSKFHPDSKLSYPFSRKVMSFCYYILLHLLFRLDVRDTQTGAKLFRAEVIQPIMRTLKTTGYAFDIEILARASQYGFRILEMPVTIDYKRGMKLGSSRIHVSDIITMFVDTLKVFRDIKF